MREYALVAMTCVIGSAAGGLREPPKEPERLAGTWVATAAEQDGQKMPAGEASALRLVFEGGRFTASYGDVTLMKGTFTADATVRPPTLDLVSLYGRGMGQTCRAVYELKGDTLRICLAQPGGKRPTEFKTTAANGCFLATYERKKP